MPLFLVEIAGSNSVSAYAFSGNLKFAASPSWSAQAAPVTVAESDAVGQTVGDRTVALFSDRETAEKVGAACHWNGQRWTVKPARGHVRTSGRLVTNVGRIVGCQEGYGR